MNSKEFGAKTIQAKFNLQKERGDFVSNYCKKPLSDQRFNLHPNYDKSSYLSKVKRVQGNQHFNHYSRRTDKLIKQACDPLRSLENGTNEFYQAE